jgi:ABC-type nitrate/sulfonate/bicarbonate transport system ATPase subunit
MSMPWGRINKSFKFKIIPLFPWKTAQQNVELSVRYN